MSNILLSKVRSDFPDYQPLQHFEALLKVFQLTVEITVLEKQQLPVMVQFFIRALNTGLRTPHQVAELLGISDTDLAAGAEIALRAGLVTGSVLSQDGHRELDITPKGHRVIAGDLTVSTAKRRIEHLIYHPTTSSIRLDNRDAIRPRQADESGLRVIGSGTEKPTLGNIPVGRLRELLATSRDWKDLELLEVVSLKRSIVSYLPGVHVFVLNDKETGEHRLVAYRAFEYLPDESNELDEVVRSGEYPIPDDAEQLQLDDFDLGAVLPLPTAQLIQRHISSNREHLELSGRLLSARDACAVSATSGAPGVTKEELQQQLAAVQRDNEDMKRQLESGGVTLIPTEDHRSWLMRAFRSAKEEVIVISPWMNLRTFDEPLMELVEAAVRRGVRVSIGYGFKSTNKDDLERHERNVFKVKQRLKRRLGDWVDHSMYDIKSTHEKILVCDRTFAIVGSFNWLSYRGEIDDGYRREVGTVVRNTVDVENVAQLAIKALGLEA